MKQLLFALFLFASLPVFSQDTDSSRLPITMTLKQKHIAYMGAILSQSNTLADAHLRDTLIKYLGSGTQPDSIITTHLSAGIFLKFVQDLLSEQANTSYSTVYELGNGATGYTGIVLQLIGKMGAGNPEKGIATWLYNKVADWLARGQAVMTEKMVAGRTWLQTPIVYN